MATITEQIAAIDAQIATKNAQVAELGNSAKSWRDSKSQCPGTKSSSKYKTCAAGKEQTAVLREQEAAGIQRSIVELNATKQVLLDSKKAENTIGIKLADQGISQPAAIIEAEGKANAAIQASQIKSTAEADAITKTADSSSMQKTMIIGFVGIILVFAAVMLIKKYAGKKKKSK